MVSDLFLMLLLFVIVLETLSREISLVGQESVAKFWIMGWQVKILNKNLIVATLNVTGQWLSLGTQLCY